MSLSYNNGSDMPLHKLHITLKAKPVETSKSISSIRQVMSREHSNALLRAAVHSRKVGKSVLGVREGYVQGGSQWDSIRETGKTFGEVRVTRNDTGVSREYRKIGNDKSRSF